MVEAPRLRHLHIPPKSCARLGVAVQKGEPMNCHICGRDTEDGPVCECADDIQRYREALNP